MTSFWTIFNNKWPDSIPPGIIFLPPPRLQIAGFGWAPRTWVQDGYEGNSISSTEPEFTAKLRTSTGFSHGLRVRYPGYLLHVENRRTVVSMSNHIRKLRFPIGQQLQEWYIVEAAESNDNALLIKSLLESKNQLAIIVPRSRPVTFPADIGLLVQNREEHKEFVQLVQSGEKRREIVSNIHHGGNVNEKVVEKGYSTAFYCEIIHRVKISRDPMSSATHVNHSNAFRDHERPKPYDMDKMNLSQRGCMPEIMISSDHDSEICLGEALDSDQIWYVDSLFPQRETGLFDNPEMEPESKHDESDWSHGQLERSRSTDQPDSAVEGPLESPGQTSHERTTQEDPAEIDQSALSTARNNSDNVMSASTTDKFSNEAE